MIGTLGSKARWIRGNNFDPPYSYNQVSGLCHVRGVYLRGRSAPHGVPPAQIRTGGFPAYGSHLGCLTAKRSLGQG